MGRADQLISTKLNPPYIRKDRVTRPQLEEKIREGLNSPLVLVIAPAGFGKTTLVSTCIRNCGMLSTWLTLDKDDNQVTLFLAYLIASLQSLDEVIGCYASDLVSGLQTAHPEAILTSLINDVDTFGKDFVLVLDDYHLIGNREIHELVSFLLEHLPQNLHLVISSRSDPALPLARLRARGQIAEFRAVDLRFNKFEGAQFLNQVMGLDLDDSSISALEKKTEGWIAGLQMAALSIRKSSHVQNLIYEFSGTNRYILDYLMEEVLASQPREIQQFLLLTSVLDRFSAPLCDKLLAENQDFIVQPKNEDHDWVTSATKKSDDILDYLERENLFLVPLDDKQQWFRYHHLFKDLLSARLQQVGPQLCTYLHKQAAAWFEENGLITEAIQHLLAAGETHCAADLIETYGPDFLANEDPSVLHLTDQLPIEIIYSHPKIGLHLAWLQIIQANTQKAIPLLYELSQHLGSQEPSSQNRWMQAVIDSALAFLFPRGSEKSSYPLPDYEQIEGIPSKEIFLRNAADFLYCMALARQGQMPQAVEIAARSVQREKNHRGSHSIPTLAPFLSRVYLILGRLRDAASLCNDYLNPANVKFIRFFYTAGSMKIDLGEVHLEWGFLDKAEDLIRDGLKDNEPWRDIMTHGIGFSTLARICIAKRDFSSAMQAAEMLEKRMREHAKPREFDEDFYTLKARIMLASGDNSGASHWADQILNNQDCNNHLHIYRQTLAQILLAQGRFGEVEKLLAGTTPPLSQHSQISKIIESKLLLAAAIAGQKRTNEAFELIESCIDMAEPEGYIQIFHDLRDYVQELLSDYSKKEIFDDQPFIQKIMEALSTTKDDVKSPATDQAVLIEALSEREIEVLQHIAEGKTNKEIASLLIVASGTVKAHTASIYRKLDAKNRTEAVAIARQMNILK